MDCKLGTGFSEATGSEAEMFLSSLHICLLFIQTISTYHIVASGFIIPHCFEGGFEFPNQWLRVACKGEGRKAHSVFV